jgi:hypothetical protein
MKSFALDPTQTWVVELTLRTGPLVLAVMGWVADGDPVVLDDESHPEELAYVRHHLTDPDTKKRPDYAITVCRPPEWLRAAYENRPPSRDDYEAQVRELPQE